jgi:hypothetical protein
VARPLSIDDLVTDPTAAEGDPKITKGEAILKALRLGVPRETASRAAGVAPATFFRWVAHGAEIAGLIEQATERDQDPPQLTDNQRRLLEFREEVEKADAQAVVYAVNLVREAMPSDWKAAMTFLERRYPGEWGRRLEVKTEPGERKPAPIDGDLAARGAEAFAEQALPPGLTVDDILPPIVEDEAVA